MKQSIITENIPVTASLTEAEIAKIRDILVEQLAVNPEQITPDARFHEDLGSDSLDDVEIAMTTEEAFNITIPDEHAEKVITVQDLCDTVAHLLGRH